MNHIIHELDVRIFKVSIVMSELVAFSDRIDIHDHITQQIMLYVELKVFEMMGLMALVDVHVLIPSMVLMYSVEAKACTLIIMKMKLLQLAF